MAENLKGCSVPCKLSLDQLQTRCRQEKVSCKLLGVSKNNINDYEVEYLCDYKRMKISQTSVLQVNAGRTHTLGSLAKLLRSKKAVEFYLVKWKDYPESENTWEPRRNLKCVKLLRQFQEDLEAELRRRRKRAGGARLDPGVASSLVQRARQRQRLERWEALLNATRNHKGRIFVRNDADLDGPPRDFTYINNYKTGDGIALTEVAVGCECRDCLAEPAGGCCAGASLHRFAYNERGQVRLRAGLPIYECNSRCRCAADCPNRVVQRGIQYDLCIFKTHDGRGWGVRTMEHIRKNCFVMEYVGEIITTEEAERRGHIYDRQGATYLFDLDYVEDVYTVDAAHYGNISHFVNHSCNPNLQVYNVFIDNLDERLPRIAFFSTRPIRAGEELTFDYKMQIDPVDAESTKMDSNFSLAGLTGSPKKRLRVECKCGVESCRKYLF